MARNKGNIKRGRDKIYRPSTPAVLPQIIVKAPNRRTSDISVWRNAIRSADSGRVKALFELYEDLLIDTSLFRAWNKRVEAVTNAELVFQTENNESDDNVDDLMESLSWENLLIGIMNIKGYDRGGAECRFDNGFKVDIIPPKHINLETGSILINDSDERGIDYTNDPHLIVLGNKRDYGLFLRTAPYAIWKRGGFGDYAQWLEIFGMPQRIGKYSSYDPQSRILLEEALKNAGSAPWIVIPQESNVETVNNTGSGSSGSSFNEFRQACNEEMLITILGNTLTTIAGDKGARSLGDVHKEVEEGINKADMRFVEKVLNTYFKPLLELKGYNVKGGKFVFPSAVEPLDVSEIISLTDVLDIPAWWLYDKYGIPSPKEGEVLAKKKTDSTAPGAEDTKEGEAKEEKKPKEPTEPKKEKKDKEQKEEKLSDERNFILQLWDKAFSFFAVAPTKWSGAFQNFKGNWTRRITGKIQLSDGYSINIDQLINEAIKEVYGNKGEELVNKKLFDITNDTLQHGIDTSLTRNDVDEDFVRQFKENAAVFAAFKNHQQTKEIAALMYDEEGKLVPYHKFRKEALRISQKYNEVWLEAEYNTAVKRARLAANLKKYEKTLHLYPNLEYIESNATDQRPEHLIFVGTVLDFYDPEWIWLMPPSDFGCDCSVRPTDKEVTGAPMKPADWKNIFTGRPDQTVEFINTSETPYYKHTDESVRNDVIEEGKRLYREYEDGKEVYRGTGNGYLEIVKQQGNERAKNLQTYKLMADNGGKYKLLQPTTVEGVKNPDAFNLTTGMFSDAKHPVTEIGKNAIQRSIRDANKQGVGEVIIRLEKDYPARDLYDGFKAAVQDNRVKNVKTIILLRNGRKPLYFDVAKLIKRFTVK
ncbi:MAG: DUF935 family protein [Dysgonomonas sp.]